MRPNALAGLLALAVPAIAPPSVSCGNHSSGGPHSHRSLVPRVAEALIPGQWGCTSAPGGNPPDCPSAIGMWKSQIQDGMIVIPAGQCRSMTHGDCEAVACWLGGGGSIPANDALGYFMNPLSLRCAGTGKEGMWVDPTKGVCLIVRRPEQRHWKELISGGV